MSLMLQIDPVVIEGQIDIARRVMRLPRLTTKERYHLSELLKMLYLLKKHMEECP